MTRTAVVHGEAPLGIVDGLHAFAAGIGFVISTPRVWGYALVPIGMALGLVSCLGLLGVWGAVRASHALFGAPAGFWAHVGSWLVIVTLSLGAFVAAMLVALCLAQPLSGFALDAIVYAQERAVNGRSSPHPPRIEALLRTWKVALVTFLVGTPILGTILVINWLFPPVLVVTVPLKFLICGWLLAWDFLDYPLGIRGLGIRARLRWVGRHFDAITAFGLSWAIFLVVPGVVLLLLPMGVAGATRLVLEEEQRFEDRA